MTTTHSEIAELRRQADQIYDRLRKAQEQGRVATVAHALLITGHISSHRLLGEYLALARRAVELENKEIAELEKEIRQI
jgi:hypothetical protein